jgi:hypothetical protein
MLTLPSRWLEIQADTIYQTIPGRLVSFAQTQIELGKKYDSQNKHLKAIEKGEVPPKGNMGLVPSQKEGYHLKSKVLGKGGNYRFHAQYTARSLNQEGEDTNEQPLYMVLHFTGLMTEH